MASPSAKNPGSMKKMIYSTSFHVIKLYKLYTLQKSRTETNNCQLYVTVPILNTLQKKTLCWLVDNSIDAE